MAMYLHARGLPGRRRGWQHDVMTPRGGIRANRRDSERLSPCVCSTLRMVTRAVTQLYDDVLRPSGLRVTQFSILATLAHLGEANLRQLENRLAVDQTTLTRSINRLERDGVIERAPHPDGRIKAVRPTAKGRRVLAVAWPLWALAQETVLGDLGTRTWADVRRRLTGLREIAVERRGRRWRQPSSAPRGGGRRPG